MPDPARLPLATPAGIQPSSAFGRPHCCVGLGCGSDVFGGGRICGLCYVESAEILALRIRSELAEPDRSLPLLAVARNAGALDPTWYAANSPLPVPISYIEAENLKACTIRMAKRMAGLSPDLEPTLRIVAASDATPDEGGGGGEDEDRAELVRVRWVDLLVVVLLILSTLMAGYGIYLARQDRYGYFGIIHEPCGAPSGRS